MSNFTDRENKRKLSGGIVSTIAGIDAPAPKGRPKEDREIKKRVTLALLPSLYEDVQKIAYIERISASELISRELERLVTENSDKIKEYDELKNSI